MKLIDIEPDEKIYNLVCKREGHIIDWKSLHGKIYQACLKCGMIKLIKSTKDKG